MKFRLKSTLIFLRSSSLFKYGEKNVVVGALVDVYSTRQKVSNLSLNIQQQQQQQAALNDEVSQFFLINICTMISEK